MSSRAQLVDVATRLISHINSPAPDTSGLAAIVKKDVVVPIPYPGSAPNFDGLAAVTAKIRVASPDFHMEIAQEIVDVEYHKVVLLLRCTGTQAG